MKVEYRLKDPTQAKTARHSNESKANTEVMRQHGSLCQLGTTLGTRHLVPQRVCVLCFREVNVTWNKPHTIKSSVQFRLNFLQTALSWDFFLSRLTLKKNCCYFFFFLSPHTIYRKKEHEGRLHSRA